MGATGVLPLVSCGACAALAVLAARGSPRAGAAVRPRGHGMVAALGELAPVRRARLRRRRARRRMACLLELPALLDVVTLGLSAGLSFDSSLELYCERAGGPLADAFGEALLSWRMGLSTREEALVGLSRELGLPSLERLATVVVEALAFGTPLADALESQAQALREERRAEVEEQIERLPVKMLVPLGTMVVPAMFLAILGPLLGSALVVG